MTIEPAEKRTTIARLVRVRPDLLEIYYDAGCMLALPQVAEVQEARRTLMGSSPYGTLTIIPEDVDFQLAAMSTDQTVPDRSQGLLIATAVVCRANMIEMLVKLYFSYFPQMHRILVTDNEAEARTWLDVQLAQSARTGS